MNSILHHFILGKLNVIDRVLKIPDCCDEDDLLHGCACQMCKFKADLTKERFDLKELVKQENAKGVNDE